MDEGASVDVEKEVNEDSSVNFQGDKNEGSFKHERKERKSFEYVNGVPTY